MEKTICELFAGVGGFRLGFERLNSGWKTVWFSQWEPGTKIQWAHDCYVKHFGDSQDNNGEYHTNEDISTVDKTAIPDHTLLVGGFPCLTGDTLVFSSRGMIPISEITTEDKVVSHDGSLHQVLNVFHQGIKPIYKLTGYAFDQIKATNNHRFYIRRRKWKYTNRKTEKYFLPPEWLSVDEIKKEKLRNIYFGMKINDEAIVPKWNGVDVYENKFAKKRLNNLDINDITLWYLVGRYLGDGWLIKQQKSGEHRSKYAGVIICCGKKKAEVFEEKINGHFKYCKTIGRTTVKYHFANIELATFLAQFGCGAGAKFLPYFVHRMPVDLLQYLIYGYLDSDGCIIKNKLQFTTISKRLAYDIASVLEKVYHKPCQISCTYRPPTTIIENRTVNQKDTYTVRCSLENIRQTAFYENGYIWYPISKISEAKNEYVYDIEVDNTHSFIANRAITHNCQDYSVAHTLTSAKGIEGKKGVLWWQIRDTLIAKKAPFCLFENVDRLLKSPANQRGRDFGVILACLNDLGYDVEWRVINAAVYGAAQRRRRTFIFAYNRKTTYAKRMRLYNAISIISENGIFAKSFPIKAVDKTTDAYLPEDIIEVSNTFKFGFENAGFMRDGIIYTAPVTEVSETPIPLNAILQSNVDERYYIPSEKMSKWEYIKGAKKIPRKSADGHEYIYSEGPMPFPDYLDKPGRTMLTSEGTLNRCTHIVSDPETKRLRILTPVEAERLQGFDDDWTNTGMPQRMRYFCMGNALVVPIITRIGKELDAIIAKEP